MNLIDSHAHIDGPDFDPDRDAVLERARQAGVIEIICVGAAGDLETAQRTVALAETYPQLHATVGIHPHDAAKMQPEWWPILEQLARHPAVVAVGETGLDYYYDHSPHDVQRRVFADFIELARRLKLPVVCHIRDAHDDARAILAEHRAAELGCVIHCFTGTPDDAAEYAAMGMFVSFSGIVTFRGKRSDPLREALHQVPLHRLLVETDCPYLAPDPVRGKRNEPAFLAHTARFMADERDLDPDQFAEILTGNTRQVFRLEDPGARARGGQTRS